ncbi:MAG: tRNA (adenosine(37)-N6)-threonylcarbamoyltransferase complex dimerization subunit type 1 TsaB [Verrucomicrobiota bacterium]|jgi:tRNA threonylcarbamoyl adenosine modification protein YeaZ
MKILAVEFSSGQRSAAVLEEGGAAAAPTLLGSARTTEGRGNLELVERALAEANCRREEIGAVAVGLGPGSYTGIRGAIALAQGWQLGRGVKTLGLSSVECLAAQAREAGLRGAAAIVIDAQRNEFYLARYQIDEAGWREEEGLRLAAFSEIQALAAAGGRLLGPDIGRWFPGAKNVNPEAAMLGRLAGGRRDFVPGEKLEPIYLREAAFKKAPAPRIIP